MAQSVTNAALTDLLDTWSGATVSITAFSSGGVPYDSETGTFGTASNQSIDLASSVVLNLQAGETVENISLSISGVGDIATVDGLNYVFTNAGTLTITSFEISLSN